MCKHHYVLDQSKDGWALAQCKWCKRINAFQNQYKSHPDPTTLAEKRDFLRSAGKVVSSNHWTPIARDKVIASIKTIGINKTAKKFNMPVSTVGAWGKGLSCNKSNRTKYQEDFKRKAVATALKTKNIRRTAINLDIPRSALQIWIKKYGEEYSHLRR